MRTLSKNDWCAHAAPRGTRDFDKAETTAERDAHSSSIQSRGEVIGKLSARDWKKVPIWASTHPVYEISRVASQQKECWKMQKLVRLRKRRSVARLGSRPLHGAASWLNAKAAPLIGTQASCCCHCLLKVNQVWRVHSRECAQIRTNWRNSAFQEMGSLPCRYCKK